MMHGCKRCANITAILILLLGLALLLVDFGIWTFWGISWWSGVLIIWGATKFCKMNYCPECAKLMKKK